MRVKSSTVLDVDYHEGLLDVTFKTGDTYRYYNVPESVAKELQHAESVGKYLNMWIKGPGYKYEKLEKKVTPTIAQLEEDTKLEIEEIVSFMEKRGLVRREMDEQGNSRVVVTGDLAQEMITNYVALPEKLQSNRTLVKRIVEAVIRQNLDPVKKAFDEYIKKKKGE